MSVEVKKVTPIEHFVQSAEKNITRSKNNYLKELQKQAKIDLENSVFPTVKNEEWKYTNLKKFLGNEFLPASELDKVELSKTEIEKLKFNSFDSHLLVFVNGMFEKELSDYAELQNKIIITSISEAIESKNELAVKYLSNVSTNNSSFDYLNLSNFVDGLFVHIPDNVVAEKPIQILNISGNVGAISFSSSRNLIVAGKNSQSTFVQKHIGLSGELYFNNVSTEMYIEKNGILNFYKVEVENDNSFHVEKTDVMQMRDSQFNHFNFTFSGKLIRNDINVNLSDENIESTLNGLYIANKSQHIDNSTFIDHAKPHSTSNQLYKGILDDKSHGVFSGKIVVAKDAQLTNAYQNSNSIILSDDARVDTKPQLEIYADDVKCTHGATVGQLDKSALFYILSRGIPKDKAMSMLITAFAESVVAELKIDELKDEINHLIFEHLNRDKVL
ncbi:MAG: Fe-S cluster assembly protein SufD [Melioribacteraceae bacterium]|jgi:Fe-S cluster assembly protein SufD|nr:Fe-S cluster assembly protein SufD [Melioribacteraceae bacterium]